MSRLRAPRPNVGTCEKTGNFDNSSMINDCQLCVSQPGYYGEKQFYCNGNCMSQYSMNAVCSGGDLVAKKPQQCLKPCIQVKPPSLSNGCADDFDCNNNKVCQKGMCVPTMQPTMMPTMQPTMMSTMQPTMMQPTMMRYIKENFTIGIL